MSDAAPVLVEREGALGHITLNRPDAINALTLEMTRAIDAALERFEHDPGILHVLLDGAGVRGFCAGGDIIALHSAMRDSNRAFPRTFWQEEYQLVARIHGYPKPVVAIMDGLVMGGGVGLSAHASHRLATERLGFAMPEVGIGFAPDVGGPYLLARAPGELGTHLVLTGERIGGEDALLCGLADRIVARASVAELVERLRELDVDAALAGLDAPAETPPSTLAAARDWIDAAYAADTVEEILERLRARPEADAQRAADLISTRSPTSLKVALRALRRARGLPSLETCLEQELHTSCAFLDAPDFMEGIRAAVIDKDRNPRWSPNRLEDVSPAAVDRYVART
ncbi:MAG: enoyl-CoA hydratase/isomerase family protein [Actinomycetota bacterium]